MERIVCFLAQPSWAGLTPDARPTLCGKYLDRRKSKRDSSLLFARNDGAWVGA